MEEAVMGYPDYSDERREELLQLRRERDAYASAWNVMLGALRGEETTPQLSFFRQLAADLNPQEAIRLGVDPVDRMQQRHVERGGGQP